jgi:hypothetical protein
MVRDQFICHYWWQDIMTISRIEVNEYKCILCNYKWINRINGKDGPIPKRCGKCKARNWDEGKMSPKENGLRRRIRAMNKLYQYLATDFSVSDPSISKWWDNELAEKFLNLHPRPTIEELKQVVYSPGLVIGLTLENRHTWKGFVPSSDNPDEWKYDKQEYLRILHSEVLTQQDVMCKIIERRGI